MCLSLVLSGNKLLKDAHSLYMKRERMRPEPLQLDQSTAGHSRESHGRPGSSTPETAAQRLGSMPDGLHTLHEAAISPIGLAPLPALSNSPSIDSSKRRKKPKLSVDLPPGEQLKVPSAEQDMRHV